MARFAAAFYALAIGMAVSISAAQAADLPIYKTPPPPLPIDPWTGFYFGANGGVGWGSKTFLDNFPTPDLALDAQPSVNGGLAGLQAGYDYHLFNWLLVGVQGDFTWSGVSNDSFSCFSFGDQDCSAHPEWFATTTGHVGATFGPFAIYGKGGAAWVEDSYTDVATCRGTQPLRNGGIPALCGDPFSANDTRFGWTVGGGVEYQIAPNWSVFGEYDFMNFGGRSVPFSDGANGFFTEEIYQKVNIVKVGVNYKFTGFGPSGYTGMLADAAAAPSVDTEDDSAKHVIAFTGVDVSKLSFDAYAGGMLAPFKDLDTSGLRLYILGDGGWYKYFDSAGNGIKGVSLSGDFLGGYAFEGDNYSLNFFGGFSAENDTLSSPDPTNKVVGTEFGVKVRTDDWYNPTPRTELHTEAEFSTAFLTYYGQGSAGYDFFNNAIFIGPDLATLGDERFTQLRAGISVTGIKIKNVQIDLSGGYANDSVVGPGGFGRLEVSTAF
jgi:outer membrane immunogenic protein